MVVVSLNFLDRDSRGSKFKLTTIRYISCLTIHPYPETITPVENYAPTEVGAFFM
jgi:hypothetical protein